MNTIIFHVTTNSPQDLASPISITQISMKNKNSKVIETLPFLNVKLMTLQTIEVAYFNIINRTKK